jgi:hypothetical protein
MLTKGDPALDVELFYRHVLSAFKSGFAPPESIASTANALLVSALPGAPFLGRKMLEQVGVDKHPALRLAYALSLLSGTGGAVDYVLGHGLLDAVLKDENASDNLKALATAARADSARLGRGAPADFEMAKAQYELAFELGLRDAAHTLGLYWEEKWGGAAPGDIVPDQARAIQWYTRGRAGSAKCAARLNELRGTSSANG